LRIEAAPIPGVFTIEPEPLRDERGFFARIFDNTDFARHGMLTEFAQWSVSYNRSCGTLRGMHYQAEPHAETKLVRCTSGTIYDVVIDLRPTSPTFRSWMSFELSGENRRALYIPEGIAHGFQTLHDHTEVLYHISCDYVPDAARGVRWNDPAFDVEWPAVPERIMSDRDQNFADFRP
jgi:dTDP-4-dehydrorhamnose 3,5-epimerase